MSGECSNCFSGCTDVHSDDCIKYTGPDISALGISNGDTLAYVTSAITYFLTSVLNGSGIKYNIEAENLCPIVSDNLPLVGEITVSDITSALSRAICDLDSRLVTQEESQEETENPYTVDCVPGVLGDEGTHSVLQATINHLCSVATDLDALEANVLVNYVLASDIDTYIETYLSSQQANTTLQKDKMVPFTVVEYYGVLSDFDATGAGTGDWIEIYLCNGNNGTPDKRGRIAIGTTSGMGGGSFNATVDPSLSGNPAYTLSATGGNNTVTLTQNQMPSHTHTSTINASTGLEGEIQFVSETFNVDGIANGVFSKNTGFSSARTPGSPDTGLSGGFEIDVNHSHTISINPIGGGEGHSNIPPVLACHYIMYIPSA